MSPFLCLSLNDPKETNFSKQSAMLQNLNLCTHPLPKYIDYRHIYSDGSKTNDRAAYGISSTVGTKSKRINNDSSIYTAEMEAIKHILQSIMNRTRYGNKFVIFCDSKSVLESIAIQESKNPIMINILDLSLFFVYET